MSHYYAGATDERRATLKHIDAKIARSETIRDAAERGEMHELAHAQTIVLNVLRSLRRQVIDREIEKPPARSELDRQAWVEAMEAVTRAQGKSC